ncbi:hypothetical protein Tco_0610139 [Tanacetum coccineum]
MSGKYPNYVNLTSLSEEQPNERTPSPPRRKKSLSPPQAPSKSVSSKSTHYTSSSSPSESLTLTHLLPQIHQMHCMDPGDGGSVGRMSCSSGTGFEIQMVAY